jgi:hypothetical protein
MLTRLRPRAEGVGLASEDLDGLVADADRFGNGGGISVLQGGSKTSFVGGFRRTKVTKSEGMDQRNAGPTHWPTTATEKKKNGHRRQIFSFEQTGRRASVPVVQMKEAGLRPLGSARLGEREKGPSTESENPPANFENFGPPSFPSKISRPAAAADR